MRPPYPEEELRAYFSSFDRMGENAVRAAIQSGIWENTDRLRHGAAVAYIHRIDENRRTALPKKPWHETGCGKILIGIIIGLIVAAVSVFKFSRIK